MSSFVEGPPMDATLQDLMLYLKPKSQAELGTELQRVLGPQPALPDTTVSDWGILTELGLEPVEFAQMALGRPELWDGGQMDYLGAVANGAEPTEQLVELAEDFFANVAAHEEQVKEVDTDDIEDDYFEGSGRAYRTMSEFAPPVAPALTPYRSPENLPIVGHPNDDWWKK